jgi:hypothetical protein
VANRVSEAMPWIEYGRCFHKYGNWKTNSQTGHRSRRCKKCKWQDHAADRGTLDNDQRSDVRLVQ